MTAEQARSLRLAVARSGEHDRTLFLKVLATSTLRWGCVMLDRRLLIMLLVVGLASIAGLLLGMAMFSVGHGVHTFGYAEILGRPVDLDWADDLRYVVGAIASTFLALVGLVLVFRSEAHDLM